jgi:hypothetical protein
VTGTFLRHALQDVLDEAIVRARKIVDEKNPDFLSPRKRRSRKSSASAP